MADIVTCHKCKVGRGYRPLTDYVELCPLHASAEKLRAALEDHAQWWEHLSRETGKITDLQKTSFRARAAAARAVFAETGGE